MAGITTIDRIEVWKAVEAPRLEPLKKIPPKLRRLSSAEWDLVFAAGRGVVSEEEWRLKWKPAERQRYCDQ